MPPFCVGDEVTVIADRGMLSSGTVLDCVQHEPPLKCWVVTVLIKKTGGIQTFNFSLFPDRVTKVDPGDES
jgi:hypothetical protein